MKKKRSMFFFVTSPLPQDMFCCCCCCCYLRSQLAHSQYVQCLLSSQSYYSRFAMLLLFFFRVYDCIGNRIVYGNQIRGNFDFSSLFGMVYFVCALLHDFDRMPIQIMNRSFAWSPREDRYCGRDREKWKQRASPYQQSIRRLSRLSRLSERCSHSSHPTERQQQQHIYTRSYLIY